MTHSTVVFVKLPNLKERKNNCEWLASGISNSTSQVQNFTSLHFTSHTSSVTHGRKNPDDDISSLSLAIRWRLCNWLPAVFSLPGLWTRLASFETHVSQLYSRPDTTVCSKELSSVKGLYILQNLQRNDSNDNYWLVGLCLSPDSGVWVLHTSKDEQRYSKDR